MFEIHKRIAQRARHLKISIHKEGRKHYSDKRPKHEVMTGLLQVGAFIENHRRLPLQIEVLSSFIDCDRSVVEESRLLPQLEEDQFLLTCIFRL